MSRILIVEDENAIARMIDMNLKIAGYETYIINDGAEAVSFIEEDNAFDLIILDIMLPGLDGFEVQKRIKNTGIPIIFLTAKSDIDSKIAGLRSGAEDYIVKPFEMLELLVRIEKVLERRGISKRILEAGDITIDSTEMKVYKNGIEILLKPMEYKILLILVKNKNRAISREQLINMAWGVEFEGESRTVDVHISQLRKKLGLGDRIVTVQKFGYRLEKQ